ncbi:hypothetical protein MAR_027660 [Mya arenaria]|uniref:Uncharacterized protein n=1 Tax=Mya arenaria TaxID=6604 RepID=A0ABY7EW04_MYAAR|nr:hypothetical protein MAR_027660 [Mya arenaria]
MDVLTLYLMVIEGNQQRKIKPISGENKQNFINMLSAHLSQSGCHTSHAEADADLHIVTTAIRAAEHSQVVVIGEDTDLLVLCFYANSDANNIFFTSDSKASFKGKKIWDLHNTIHVLGEEVRKLLVFIHAFTGYDTTSRLYGIDSLHDGIELAGIAVITSVYGGTHCQGLDLLRYCKFDHKVQTKKVLSLPPTSTAAKYHSYRVYLQVQTWIGRDISPTDWVWTMNGDKLVPVKTSLPAAPERLLKMIRSACGECHGLSCSKKGELFDETEQD